MSKSEVETIELGPDEVGFQHGELTIVRVDEVPEGWTNGNEEDGKAIVGHSETGHHHVIERGAIMYNPPETWGDELERQLNAYLVVNEVFADLKHKREFDTHPTIRMPEGTYRVHRQREYSPQGLRQVQD